MHNYVHVTPRPGRGVWSGYATPGATREAPIIKMEHVRWRWLHLSQRIIDRYPSGTNSLIFWKSGTNPLANKFRRNKFADRNKFAVTPDRLLTFRKEVLMKLLIEIDNGYDRLLYTGYSAYYCMQHSSSIPLVKTKLYRCNCTCP